MTKPALPRLRKALKDERGVSAVEFALIAPVLILLYCGLAELGSAIMASRQASHATSTVGDITAQLQQTNAATMYNYLLAADDVMNPFPATNSVFPTRVTSLSVRAGGVVQVDWSCTPVAQSTLPALAKNATVTTVPANLLDTTVVGDSIIESDSAYKFAPPSTWVLKTGLTFNNTFYFKPRQSSSITYVTTTNTPTAVCNG
jgi:Flp pilus assembly protein TadG